MSEPHQYPASSATPALVTLASRRFVSPPNVTRLLGFLALALVPLGLIQSALSSAPPSPITVLTALLAACALFLRFKRRAVHATLFRAGFYVGLLAYYLSTALLKPSVWQETANDTNLIVSLIYLLTLLGFEIGYSVHTGRKGRPIDFSIPSQYPRFLVPVIVAGVLIWFSSALQFSRWEGIPLLSLLLNVRGQLEMTRPDPLGYLRMLPVGMLWMSAAAASLALTGRFHVSGNARRVCWLAIGICLFMGATNGSRAIFMYSMVPLGAVLWVLLSDRRRRALRWLLITTLVLGIPLVMIVIRQVRIGDLRDFEWSTLEFDPGSLASDLNIHSTVAQIVEAFPDRMPYEYGKSLVPLVVGWLPRPLWPEKPYPFSILLNVMRGETLEKRASSLAIGPPGEGYGNFGLFGVALWAAVLGFFCRRGDNWLRRLPADNTLTFMLGATGAVWMAQIVRGGVAEMFYMGLGVFMFPYLFLRFIARRARVIQAQPVSIRKPAWPQARVAGPRVVRHVAPTEPMLFQSGNDKFQPGR